MQPQQHSADLRRRFERMELSNSVVTKTDSDKIAEQIAEFEKRGGKITEIPIGVGSLSAGSVIASEEPHGMAVPRNSKRNTKTKTATGGPDVTVEEAAELIERSASFIAKRIKAGDLISHKTEGCRAHFLKRKDVLALKQKLQQGTK